MRDIVVREVVSNTLIHREFTSSFPAKLVIDDEGLRTENASRAMFEGRLTLADFNPVPKNPIIANFFTQIGYAEELGSGLRNLEKYARPFLGADPVLQEGDVFVARIPRSNETPSTTTAVATAMKATTRLAIMTLLKERGFPLGCRGGRWRAHFSEDGCKVSQGAGRGGFGRARWQREDKKVLLDGCAGKVTAHREPYADDIEKLCIAAHFGDAKLWASTQSYADAYCVLSRTASKEEVKKAFAATLEFFLVVEIYAAGLKPALESDCGDLRVHP